MTVFNAYYMMLKLKLQTIKEIEYENNMISDKVVIKNPTGLHLRPAGLFCKTAMQYKSKITVYKKMKNEEVNANAKSVLSVLGACIKSGDEITIICEGEDEETALSDMVQLVKDGLGE